jgi:hypothetical protein
VPCCSDWKLLINRYQAKWLLLEYYRMIFVRLDHFISYNYQKINLQTLYQSTRNKGTNLRVRAEKETKSRHELCDGQERMYTQIGSLWDSGVSVLPVSMSREVVSLVLHWYHVYNQWRDKTLRIQDVHLFCRLVPTLYILLYNDIQEMGIWNSSPDGIWQIITQISL